MAMMTPTVDPELPLVALCSTMTLRLTYSSSSFRGGCMLSGHRKGNATAGDEGRGEHEERQGQTRESGRGEEAPAQPVMRADRPDDERSGPDSCVECPDDAAERSCPSGRIRVRQDERHERGVGTSETDAEDDRGEDHLPPLGREGQQGEGHRY